MRLNEIASAGATASGGIATVNGAEAPLQKRNIYGDITLEDLDFDPDSEAGGSGSVKEYDTWKLYKALTPMKSNGAEPEAEYIDMLQHILMKSDHHKGHHGESTITPAQFQNLLTHWRVTPRDFGLSDEEVADLLHHVLQKIGFGQLLSGMDGQKFGNIGEVIDEPVKQPAKVKSKTKPKLKPQHNKKTRSSPNTVKSDARGMMGGGIER